MVRKKRINPNIFRAYDIRGIVGEDLTAESAFLVGKGIGTYLNRVNHGKIVVGGDNRTSTEFLKNAMINGLISTGTNVIDLGLSTSPMMYVSVFKKQAIGGVNVTGSHNPIEYNGFKIVSKNAYPVSSEGIQEIRQIIETKAFISGQGEVESHEFGDEYLDGILKRIKIGKKFRVVVDTGNGVAGKYLPRLLFEMGCFVEQLHCDLDGNFPNHLPNPEKVESLYHVADKVVSSRSEVGLATDGDGDRLGLIDSNGKVRTSDEILVLLERDFLRRHPGEKVLVDVKISKKVIEDIRRSGGVPFLWKTGHSLIKTKMREDNILLGGELSGHMFVFENYYPIDDALFTIARLLKVIEDFGSTVQDLLADLPNYVSTPLIEVYASDRNKFAIVNALTDEFRKKYQVIAIDGARVEFDNGWAVIRASNTTPNLTLRFEADTDTSLSKIEDEVYSKLNRYLRKFGEPSAKVT